jgi:hypothetical protein
MKWNICLITVLTIFLNGCGTATPNGILVMDDNIYPFETGYLKTRLTKKDFRFKSNVVKPSELKSWVIKNIKNSITNAYKSRKLPPAVIERNAFQKGVNYLARLGDKRNSPKDKSSLRFKEDEDGVYVSFISGEYLGNRAGEAIQQGYFKVNQYTENGYIKFDIIFPENYVFRKGNIGSQSLAHPLFSEDELNSEYIYAFNAIKIQNFAYRRHKLISGEFNSNYPDDAVYANYKRRTIIGTNDKSIQKSGSLVMDIDGYKANANVAVYPYRRGSKVVYDVSFNNLFSLTPEGKDSFSEFPSKKAVENTLLKIANE